MKPEDIEQALEQHETQPLPKTISQGEIIIGVFSGLNKQGKPMVTFQENPSATPVVAISTVALNQQQTGRQLALLFAEGDLTKPVIMGLIHSTLDTLLENFEQVVEKEASTVEEKIHKKTTDQIDDITLNGKRVVLEGKEEIVLKCGDSSITLTKAGKILIRGKYLQSRSAGVNRILGGSVQVN